MRLVWLLPLLLLLLASCIRGGFGGPPADGPRPESQPLDAFDAFAPRETGTDASSAWPALARWRINEAATGQLPTLLLDDTPDPVNLALTYDGANPVFATGLGGGRHLRFDGKSTAGGMANIAGTKLDTLHGRRKVTLEAKFRLDGCTPATDQQRLFGLADGDEGGLDNWLTARIWQERFGLAVSWAGGSGWVFYSASCPAAQTSIVHWVIDTDQPTAADHPGIHRRRADPNSRRRGAQRKPPLPADPGRGARLGQQAAPRHVRSRPHR
jgi:hypothetical protein